MESISINNDCYIGSIDGEKCAQKSDALKEISNTLLFPKHFGSNLDALYDCLTDLSWIDYPAILLVINNLKRFLRNEDSTVKQQFMELFSDIQEEQKGIDDGKSFRIFFTGV